MRARDLITNSARSASREVANGVGPFELTEAVNSPGTSSSSALQTSGGTAKPICTKDSHIHSRQVLKDPHVRRLSTHGASRKANKNLLNRNFSQRQSIFLAWWKKKTTALYQTHLTTSSQMPMIVGVGISSSRYLFQCGYQHSNSIQ